MRVIRGATSLSTSKPFPLMENSAGVNPGMFPPGSRRLSDNAASDRIGNLHKDDGYSAGHLLSERRPQGSLGPRITSGFKLTSSIALSSERGQHQQHPSDNRSRMLSPSFQLSSCRPRTNAAMRSCASGSFSSSGWSTPDPPWLLAPLRTRRERPYGRQTAEECDEIAAPHVRSRVERPHPNGSNTGFDRGEKRH